MLTKNEEMTPVTAIHHGIKQHFQSEFFPYKQISDVLNPDVYQHETFVASNALKAFVIKFLLNIK